MVEWKDFTCVLAQERQRKGRENQSLKIITINSRNLSENITSKPFHQIYKTFKDEGNEI